MQDEEGKKTSSVVEILYIKRHTKKHTAQWQNGFWASKRNKIQWNEQKKDRNENKTQEYKKESHLACNWMCNSPHNAIFQTHSCECVPQTSNIHTYTVCGPCTTHTHARFESIASISFCCQIFDLHFWKRTRLCVCLSVCVYAWASVWFFLFRFSLAPVRAYISALNCTRERQHYKKRTTPYNYVWENLSHGSDVERSCVCVFAFFFSNIFIDFSSSSSAKCRSAQKKINQIWTSLWTFVESKTFFLRFDSIVSFVLRKSEKHDKLSDQHLFSLLISSDYHFPMIVSFW